jgi:cell division protein FtsB
LILFNILLNIYFEDNYLEKNRLILLSKTNSVKKIDDLETENKKLKAKEKELESEIKRLKEIDELIINSNSNNSVYESEIMKLKYENHYYFSFYNL